MFLESEKLSFCKAELLKFHESSAEKITIFLEPEKLCFFAKPCLYEFYKISAQKTFFKSLKKNNVSELEKMFFCKAQFHPVRQ